MKTVHISDGLWKALKLRSVEWGVPLREVLEEAGSLWLTQPRIPPYGTSGYAVRDEVARQCASEIMDAPKSAQVLAKELGLKTARELTVEMEE